MSLASCQRFGGKKNRKQQKTKKKKKRSCVDRSLGAALSAADKSFELDIPDVFGTLWFWCYPLIISGFCSDSWVCPTDSRFLVKPGRLLQYGDLLLIKVCVY